MDLSISISIMHAAATLFMAGLIWFVQIVHYPLMQRVGHDGFVSYMQHHQALTGRVVAVPMLLEMATGLWWVFFRPAFVPTGLALASIGLLTVIWLSTACLQVPQHAKLAKQYNAQACRFLVRSHWVRTLAWSLRAAIVCYVMGRL